MRREKDFRISRAMRLAAITSICTLPDLAIPLTTDAGNTIQNWTVQTNVQYMGVTIPFVQVQENGGTVVGFAPFVPLTDQEKLDLATQQRNMHPSLLLVALPTSNFDCHGFTFKSGNLWIDDDQVRTILVDQGWVAPADGKAKVNDIVVYEKDGNITHSGIVTGVDTDGNVTRVESKWGADGLYTHAPNDVPAEYGTYAVLTGGKPLKDPPAALDDLSFFANLGIPTTVLKHSLLTTSSNTYPSATLSLTGSGGNTFDYKLTIPNQPLSVDVGDTISLYAPGLTGAFVSGDALSAGWVAQLFLDHVTWTAQFSGTLTADLTGLVVEDQYSSVGTAAFRETVAGDVGLTQGPVAPEPATMVLMGLGLIAVLSQRTRRDRQSR